MKTNPPYRLMTPGPVPIHPAVLRGLSEPPLHHRTRLFKQILRRCLIGLKKVFQTNQPVMILTSTGTGAMEAAIANVLSPGDQVLAVEAGKFGQRWAQMAKLYGAEVDALAIPWGMAVTAEQIRKELQLTPFKAVMIQACETSTGVYQPVEEIAKVVREFPNTLLMVDGITAVGAMPMLMDEWGIDILIAGSQKAFMLPTGLSFIALSEKAWKAQEKACQSRFYLDLRAERDANEKEQTHFSSPVNLIRALDFALELMLRDGLSQHLQRIEDLAQAIRQGGEALGLSLFPSPPSNSLSVFAMPEEVAASQVRDHLEENYNITIMAGQDRLKDKILRIGHMGDISDEDAVETMRNLGHSLHALQPLIFGRSLPDEAARQTAKALNYEEEEGDEDSEKNSLIDFPRGR